MLGHQAAAAEQRRRAGSVLEDEALRVFAALDVGQHLLHRHLGLGSDDLRARHVLAVLGVVADRVVHVGDAAFIDQVDDQLQLVQALEIGHLGRVAGLDQRLVAGLDQFDRAATKHGLLAEQVGLGLLAEVGLDDAGLAAAVGRGVAERQIARLAALVGMHGDQVRHAAALGIGVAHGVARGLRRDHPHIEVGARDHLAEVHVKAMGERQRGAFADIRLDRLAVHGGDLLVRQQHHHHVGTLDGHANLGHLQAGLLHLGPGRTALAQTDRHLDAAVAEILRVRMALRAVAHDRDLLALDQAQVGVLVVIDLHAVLRVKRLCVRPAGCARRGRYRWYRCALSRESLRGRWPR
jgi:hypothetical protein